MRSGIFAAAVAACVGVVGWSQSADAALVELVVNGEFENPVCASSWCALNEATVPGWSTTDRQIEIWPQGSFSSPTVGSDGLATGQHLEINTHASQARVTQEIFVPLDINSAVDAQFSFDAWSRNGGGGFFSVVGSVSGDLVASTAMALDGRGWTDNSRTFSLIAGETVTLSFETVTGTSWITPHIDQVSLRIETLPLVQLADVGPANLPEPGSLALFGLGLAGLGAVAGRRRRTR